MGLVPQHHAQVWQERGSTRAGTLKFTSSKLFVGCAVSSEHLDGGVQVPLEGPVEPWAECFFAHHAPWRRTGTNGAHRLDDVLGGTLNGHVAAAVVTPATTEAEKDRLAVPDSAVNRLLFPLIRFCHRRLRPRIMLRVCRAASAATSAAAAAAAAAGGAAATGVHGCLRASSTHMQLPR